MLNEKMKFKKAFISILGTNNYLECRHSFKGEVKDNIIKKYVQEDLVHMLCREWDENSEIRIFLTDDAKKKNWLNDGHKDRSGNTIENMGLKKRLELLNIKARIIPFEIPIGNDEKEVWEIFNIIHNSFSQGEEIYVDITHAFRYLPMLLTILLNYSKLTKEITVKGIFYASFESLGTISEVENIPTKDRIVPIIDFSSFTKLQDWSLATYDYFTNANTNELNKLIKAESLLYKSSDARNHKESLLLREVVTELENLSNYLAFCRGKELFNKDIAAVIDKLKKVKEINNIVPMQPLFDIIISKISPLVQDDFKKVYAMVEWCKKHQLYQQAITLLQEFIITLVLKSLNEDYTDKRLREIVSSAFSIRQLGTPEKEWRGEAAKFPDKTYQYLNSKLLSDFTKLYGKITSIRNDINHSGFLKDARNTKSIKGKLDSAMKLYYDYIVCKE